MESFIHFELKKTLSKIVDVHLDADLNLFCLTLLAGTPHVLISSLFSQVSIFQNQNVLENKNRFNLKSII